MSVTSVLKIGRPKLTLPHDDDYLFIYPTASLILRVIEDEKVEEIRWIEVNCISAGSILSGLISLIRNWESLQTDH